MVLVIVSCQNNTGDYKNESEIKGYLFQKERIAREWRDSLLKKTDSINVDDVKKIYFEYMVKIDKEDELIQKKIMSVDYLSDDNVYYFKDKIDECIWEVINNIYIENGWVFSPGGGYWYLSKSKHPYKPDDDELKRFRAKINLANNLEEKLNSN